MNLLLVFVGFSLIVIIHELGHFLAARWAGIRVQAFAVGFGPALFSWRSDLGFRRGGAPAADGERVPTEYRWNFLPFGGYVKMLGQEDLDPTAVSDSPDSYQNCPPWKRMIVISAGVIMNLIAGALLFMVVFLAGLETEPPLVGAVDPGSPASRAMPVNANEAGVATPGLQGGDRVTAIDGKEPRSFNDLVMASLMSKRGEQVELTIERDGVDLPLRFELEPQLNVLTRFREVGIRPERSTQVVLAPDAALRQRFDQITEMLGWDGVRPGMDLVRVGDHRDPATPAALTQAARRSAGAPIEAEFRDAEGTVTIQIESSPEFQTDLIPRENGKYLVLSHLLGLAPAMAIGEVGERGASIGLEAGDIFARIGDLEYPTYAEGQHEIQSHPGETLAVAVLRRDPTGTLRRVELEASVSDEGRFGFTLMPTGSAAPVLAAPPAQVRSVYGREAVTTPPAREILRAAGTTVVEVADRPVGSFGEVRSALLDATREALQSGSSSVTVPLTLLEAGDRSAGRRVEWTLQAADVRGLHSLGWFTRDGLTLFQPEQILLRADGPLGAMKMGVLETHNWILRTYVTFARLFHGTVKIEHLKGPIGIAHLGTMVADRGLIWLLFFMGLISVNLAVINFLPLPIVDGGQFLFLVFEQVRGRPVSVGVQNAITVVGLVALVSLFLLITYNDIVGLFAGS